MSLAMSLDRALAALFAVGVVGWSATVAIADNQPPDFTASLIETQLDAQPVRPAVDELSILRPPFIAFQLEAAPSHAAPSDAAPSDAAANPDESPTRNETWPAVAPAPQASCRPATACKPDPKKKKKLAAAAAGAYKPLYFDNKFDYLLDPAYDDYHLGEELKRRCLGNYIVWDVGGEYRMRYHSEHNMRLRPLSGPSDDFLLQRTRLYLNAEVGDRFRFYGEALDARSDGQRFLPRAIEVNKFDGLNLFGDYLVSEDQWGGKLFVRGGRQELLYGAQRLVSPLDWANTRRTFDGVKLFYTSSDWDLDAWWTKPVPLLQHLNLDGTADRNFDSHARDADFVGVYASKKVSPGRVADFYFLRLSDDGALDFHRNLFAGRMLGGQGPWLWEMEGGYQFGKASLGGREDVRAGFATVGLGRKFAQVLWQPTLWVYYDWASGDDDPTDGVTNTFFQYFPLAHKYLGFMDIIARQNIGDYNVLLTMTPREKLKLLMWYHVFHLADATDALYNAAGVPIYRDTTGGSGTYIGQELDIALQWTVRPRASVLFGYSHFWAGTYFDSPTIQGQGANGLDADFFYTQFSLRF